MESIKKFFKKAKVSSIVVGKHYLYGFRNRADCNSRFAICGLLQTGLDFRRTTVGYVRSVGVAWYFVPYKSRPDNGYSDDFARYLYHCGRVYIP